MFLSKKMTSLDEQLSAYAEQLYGKIVPQNVRDYIEMTAKQQVESKTEKVCRQADQSDVTDFEAAVSRCVRF